MDYPAQAFHDDLDGGRTAGSLRTGPGGLVFEADGRRVEIPIAGLRLREGGAASRLIFLSHPGLGGWSFCTRERRILGDPVLLAEPGARAQARSVRRHRLGRWATVGAILLAGVGGLLGIVAAYDPIVAYAARQVPPDWEREISAGQLQALAAQQPLLDDDAVKRALAALTAPLVAAAPGARHPFEFHVALADELNAFALPGGQIVVHSGLVLEAGSAAELLGVVAHEMAHVTEQHGMRALIASAGILIGAQVLLGDVGGALGTLAGAAPFLLHLEYSRDHEAQADREAVRILRRAGVDPRGLPAFFARLVDAREQMLDAAGLDEDARRTMESALAILGTHPATEDRIDDVVRLVGDAPPASRDLGAEFAALVAAVRDAVDRERSASR